MSDNRVNFSQFSANEKLLKERRGRDDIIDMMFILYLQIMTLNVSGVAVCAEDISSQDRKEETSMYGENTEESQ